MTKEDVDGRELPTTQSTPRTEEIERLCALIQLECSEPCGRLVRHLADEALRVGALERELAEEVEWNGPYRARLVREITEERAIVDRVWKALGIENYEQAKPYAIDEHVTNLRAALSSATEAKQALIEKVIGWAHDGRLQTFEDRERFRKWARALKEPS